jgi:hypothetical protein
VSIIPDTKDWTWVLVRPCVECGFDSSLVPATEVASLIRASAGAWASILLKPPGELRARARDDRWSPLEYACHVRDVFSIFDQRLHLMLAQESPLFANWNQDETAVKDRYGDQEPSAVASELAAAAATLAASFDTVEGAAWDRRGFRSDGAAFTIATLGRYLIHDPVHHLYDVNVDLARLESEPVSTSDD